MPRRRKRRAAGVAAGTRTCTNQNPQSEARNPKFKARRSGVLDFGFLVSGFSLCTSSGRLFRDGQLVGHVLDADRGLGQLDGSPALVLVLDGALEMDVIAGGLHLDGRVC